MHRILLLTGILLVSCTVPSWAQIWERAYGGSGSEIGKFIEPTRDGGFFIAGTQSEFSNGPERFWVARFDADGNMLWDTTYGNPGMTHTLFAFSRTSDGGFLAGGFTGVQGSGSESALMYRADSNGRVMFENDVNYNDSDHWHLLLERVEGGYYMGGHTDSKGDARGDMWLQKLDETRQVIWEKVYNRNTGEHAHSGVITSDGGVILLGHTEAGGREKFWAVKVDSAGTIQWQKVFSSAAANHDSPYKVFETAEGNFAFIGGSGDPNSGLGTMWLLVVNPAGTIVIDKHYGAASGSTFSWSGRQTSDGGFILAGHTNYRTRGQLDMIVVKTDASGNQEWEEKYGGTGYDYGFDVIEVIDGYVVAGYTGSGSLMVGGGGDVYVVKIEKRVIVAPDAVTLRTPVNSAANQAVKTRLTWSAAVDATRYEVQVATDSSFSSIAYRDTTEATTADTAAGLMTGSRYFWRVRGINTAGAGPWSVVWSFTTAVPLPAAVILLSPETGANVPLAGIDLVWQGGQSDVDRYWLDVGPNSSFTTKSSDTGLTSTSWSTIGLEAGRTYWWRVRAHNSAGWGPFSGARSFTVVATTSATEERATIGAHFAVAPNPATDAIEVRFNLESSGEATLTLRDQVGNRVASFAGGYRGRGEHLLSLDVSTLASGVYLVLLEAGDGRHLGIQRISIVR